MSDQQKLEQRRTELEAEAKTIQAKMDAQGAAAEQAERLMSAAVKRFDLEGDDSAEPEIERYRLEKATAQTEFMRLQGIRDSIPARLAAIRLELDHVAHRSDLQLLTELKRTEQVAFLEYEAAAIKLIDANYNFQLRRHEREQVANKVASFASGHGLQSPSKGNFAAPVIETYWGNPGVYDQIKRQFSDAKKEFN